MRRGIRPGIPGKRSPREHPDSRRGEAYDKYAGSLERDPFDHGRPFTSVGNFLAWLWDNIWRLPSRK